MYAIRTSDQRYRLAAVNGRFASGKRPLAAPRTFALSPFAREGAVIYTAGHDSDSQISSDVAWVYRAPLVEFLKPLV